MGKNYERVPGNVRLYLSRLSGWLACRAGVTVDALFFRREIAMGMPLPDLPQRGYGRAEVIHRQLLKLGPSTVRELAGTDDEDILGNIRKVLCKNPQLFEIAGQATTGKSWGKQPILWRAKELGK